MSRSKVSLRHCLSCNFDHSGWMYVHGEWLCNYCGLTESRAKVRAEMLSPGMKSYNQAGFHNKPKVKQRDYVTMVEKERLIQFFGIYYQAIESFRTEFLENVCDNKHHTPEAKLEWVKKTLENIGIIKNEAEATADERQS